MPTNYTSYFSRPAFQAVNAVWHRNNSLKANVQAVQTAGAYIQANGYGGSPFFEQHATGGDSGSPVFLVHGTNLAFACALHFAGISGPFVSYPANFSWIQARLGTNTLSVVDLSGLRTF
jgi:hypothetical protein